MKSIDSHLQGSIPTRATPIIRQTSQKWAFGVLPSFFSLSVFSGGLGKGWLFSGFCCCYRCSLPHLRIHDLPEPENRTDGLATRGCSDEPRMEDAGHFRGPVVLNSVQLQGCRRDGGWVEADLND